MANEYDIVRAFQKIEEDLIASMKRNLSRHIKEERKEGFNWSMWQAEQLNSLKEFKKQNPKLFKKYFSTIDKDIEDVLKKAYESGQAKQEALILENLKKEKSRKTKSSFFKINDRKLKALITEAQTGISKASSSILRYTNDQYRKIIFNAQVYSNTGVGTPEQAVDMATRDFLSAGLNSIQYSNGARVNIASYAAMAIQTANKRAYLQGEGAKRDEWGIHTVIVHSRGGGCPFCTPFQGRAFIDDVWSSGTAKESEKTGYPLLSTAIAGGLFHPNCKDKATTYFPGINSEPTPPTKEEIEIKKQNYRKDQKLKYINRNIEKYRRLELGSIDDANCEKYHDKRIEWQEYKKRFKDNSNETFYDSNGIEKFRKSDIILQKLNKEVKEDLHYTEITDQLMSKKKYQIKRQKYFISEDGIKHDVDGKHVVSKPTQKEIEIAGIIGEAIGGKVNIIPRVNQPFGIKTPDYIINGEKFDLKEITGGGKYTIQGNLKGKQKQSDNFVIDISNAKFDIKEAQRQIENIYNSKHYMWVDKIFLVQEKNIINAYKRVKR